MHNLQERTLLKTMTAHAWCEPDIPCVVHRPTEHHMRMFPLHWRSDRGIFERICPHGVGHGDPDQFEFWRLRYGSDWMGMASHGCPCACCYE